MMLINAIVKCIKGEKRQHLVKDLDRMEIQPYQIVPIIVDFSYVENIVPAQFELIFLARDIPPLGMIKFVVTNNAFGQVAPPIESFTVPDMYTLGDNVMCTYV